nr:MAG TPA: hypothetical protein [Caudoviricetes sp.]
MRYAIVTDGTATNVIELRPSVTWPGAVALGERPVGIGDTYQDGKFYRGGQEVLTAQEEIERYKAALNTLGVVTDED